MMVRVGIPASFRRFSGVASSIDAPILVSANAFWRDGHFRLPAHDLFRSADVALDSAGFVAMAKYGGYRWTVGQYVDLAASHAWAWWASMDFCCEPEILQRRGVSVSDCIRRTVAKLEECQNAADSRGVAHPMPVLQGWEPHDYLRCFASMRALPLPDLIAVGSVCRRQLGGEIGLLKVLSTLDRELPPRFRFHLFGVKGDAIRSLAGHPRIASVDSMAWDYAARRAKHREGRRSCDVAFRESHLRSWYGAQVLGLGLFRTAA